MKLNEFYCLLIIIKKQWARPEKKKCPTMHPRKITGKETNDLNLWFETNMNIKYLFWNKSLVYWHWFKFMRLFAVFIFY